MAKLTLADLVNLQNEPTAVGVINSNSDLIEAAMEKTLSRDGTSPNTMGAKLDMNSNRIMNLPKPVNALEPLRYKDLSDFVGGGTVTNIPEGGTSGMSLVKTADTDYLVGWSNQFPIGYYGAATPTSWNTLYAYGAGSHTPLQAASKTGEIAVYGASRTSDGGGGLSAAVGVIGWGFNDRTAADVAAWGGYFEGRSYVNAYTHGIEVHATNLSGSTVDINPYSMYTHGASSSLWVCTGGSVGPGNPAYNPATGESNITTPNSASVAIGIVSEGNPTFRKGIVFGSKSIQGSDGSTGTGVAIQMGKGHKISYTATGGSEVANILSTATSGSMSLNLYSGGLAIQDYTNTTTLFNFTGLAGTTDTLSFQARTAGNGALIQSAGGTNVGLVLVAKGTGKVYLGSDTYAALSITAPSSTPNYLDIAGTATGSSPVISATGGDTNISIILTPKGTGLTRVGALADSSGNTYTIGGNFSTAAALSLPSVAQGALLYGSATGVVSTLAKDTNASRFLKNSGTSNNPAWAQPAFSDLSGSVAASQMPALTGDVTTVAGNVATTLATVNSNVGTFGSATQVGQFTVNAKGLVTAASAITITPAVGSITGLGTGVAAFLATPSSANLATAVTDETGTGALVFGTSPTLATPTFTTSFTSPLHIGGSATGQTLTLQSTTSLSASGDKIRLVGGNNGATTIADFFGTGAVTIYGSLTMTSTIAAGLIDSSGGSAGLRAQGRDANGAVLLYRTGGISALWDPTNSDYYQYGTTNKNHIFIGNIATTAPVTVTGTSYGVGITDMSIVFNTSATCSVTMPSASTFPGRHLWVKNIAAQTINSAGSDIVPINSATAGSALLSNTAGKWAHLQSNGTAWVIMGNN